MRADTKRFAREAAWAPSSHNTQPWMFRLEGDAIALHADMTRRLPVNDPTDRELHISCGAALLTLQVSAAHHGFGTHVDYLPAAHAEVIGRVTFVPGTDRLAALHPGIRARHTVRGRFRDAHLPEALLDSLQSSALDSGSSLIECSASQRAVLAELVERGDHAQWSDRAWRNELASWLRPASHGDGLAVPAVAAPFARFAIRHLDMGSRMGRQDRERAMSAPALMLLTTATDTRLDWIRAGEALQRVLLEAARADVQASYLNQPLQVAGLREELRQVLGLEGFPQMLFALGYPTERLKPSARRPFMQMIQANGSAAG